jgi:tRNA threonylcarbamoyl adenosine modification protein YeaZ
MNYLLVNTANEELVILLYKNGEIYACNEVMVKKHNEVILPKLNELLTKANISLSEVDEFGVVVGPGSFTGIRVGIATVKAFKDVYNKPVRVINNLDLLYNIAKAKNIECKAVAIEGSLNSYFVGKIDGNKLNIYERNLTQDELLDVAGGGRVAMYANTHELASAECVEFSNQAFLQAFLDSNSYNLTPVYYQLSQAENDKIDMADLTIREAEVWDIKAISELDKANFNNAWDEEMLEQMLLSKSSIIYVVELEQQIVGFLVAENDIDEFNISRVVVAQNFRNHGIGTKLINHIEEVAKLNKMNVSLEVSVNNFTAKTLYEKLGYTLRRVRKEYYKDKSDCLEMVKVFN